MDIKKYNYGNKDNHDCTAIKIGDLTIYFSCDIVVAFRHPSVGLLVSRNIWSITTEQHLYALDHGKRENRLPRANFERQLEEIMKEHKLTT